MPKSLERRFRLFMAGESMAYVAHPLRLGGRCDHGGEHRVGLAVAKHISDWLPLLASCLGTLALFLLQGIPMRLLMLCGTALWIANNVISGSIGGTVLEVVVSLVNTSTIFRLYRHQLATRPTCE